MDRVDASGKRESTRPERRCEVDKRELEMQCAELLPDRLEMHRWFRGRRRLRRFFWFF